MLGCGNLEGFLGRFHSWKIGLNYVNENEHNGFGELFTEISFD